VHVRGSLAHYMERVHPMVARKPPDNVPGVETSLESIQDLHDDLSEDSFQSSMHDVELKVLLQLFIRYLDILLGFIRASREDNWLLYLASVRDMIPWCFAYDKVNYARYPSVYYADMSQLPDRYPDVYPSFLNGLFAVQIGSANPFGKIPVDQTTEETVNRDTEVPT
jgi:hypothetical protein